MMCEKKLRREKKGHKGSEAEVEKGVFIFQFEAGSLTTNSGTLNFTPSCVNSILTLTAAGR